MDRQEPCCFDEWASRNAKRARKSELASPVSRRLLAALEPVGFGGQSVLDLGCGTGDLALATLARGATRATGIDLGTGAIDEARALAAERGLSDRVAFDVGDGSTAPLARHDVVVLNRVYCCYPNVDALLANSVPAAGRVYAFSAPVSGGPAGLLNRLQFAFSNVWFRLRDRKFKGFRVFVHDLDDVDRRIRDAGFRRVAAARARLVWHLAVYERP